MNLNTPLNQNSKINKHVYYDVEAISQCVDACGLFKEAFAQINSRAYQIKEIIAEGMNVSPVGGVIDEFGEVHSLMRDDYIDTLLDFAHNRQLAMAINELTPISCDN